MPDDSITIDEFVKVHLVVGTIEQCEEIAQSDKLYKLQVNFGSIGHSPNSFWYSQIF